MSNPDEDGQDDLQRICDSIVAASRRVVSFSALLPGSACPVPLPWIVHGGVAGGPDIPLCERCGEPLRHLTSLALEGSKHSSSSGSAIGAFDCLDCEPGYDLTCLVWRPVLHKAPDGRDLLPLLLPVGPVRVEILDMVVAIEMLAGLEGDYPMKVRLADLVLAVASSERLLPFVACGAPEADTCAWRRDDDVWIRSPVMTADLVIVPGPTPSAYLDN